MGFISKIFRKLSSKDVTTGSTKVEQIGNLEPCCPYCDFDLEKMPGRKKKCPNCEQYIYVRTCPLSGEKVLIREDQKDQLEEQWAIANNSHEQFLESKQKKQAMKEELIRQGNPMPTETDIEWYELESSLSDLAAEYKWGLYRNARLGMGKILKKRGLISDALDVYLEVCFLDLNGPNNCNKSSPALMKAFPPFDPKLAILAPAVLSYISTLANELQIGRDELAAGFIKQAKSFKCELELPVSPEDAWGQLSSALD